MRKLILCCTLFISSGCTTDATRVEVTAAPNVEVKTFPVTVRCIAPDKIPLVPVNTRVANPKPSDEQIAAALTADLYALDAYAIAADAALRACATTTPEPTDHGNVPAKH